MADALAVVAKQLTHTVGEFQRTAHQLNDDYAGAVRAANRATVSMLEHVGSATAEARLAVAAFRKTFSLDYTRALAVLGLATWLFGIATGVAFERWRGAGPPAVPHATAVPAPVAEPSSSADSTSITPTPATARDRRRASSQGKPPDHDGEPARGTDMEHGSNGDGTASSPDGAKPKA